MPTIDYNARLNVLVSVRGHPFDRTEFDDIFIAMDGISATMVDQPAAAQLMNPQGMAPYDALVLYDMPGLDFDAERDRPTFVDPGEAFKSGFRALLEQGVGIVALHHAIAGWPAWKEFADILGGAFLYKPEPLRGTATMDSGYRHDTPYEAKVLIPEHPVMQGIPASFPIQDEVYLMDVFEDRVTPLLRAEYDFSDRNFSSANLAMQGKMNSNADWKRPPGSSLIGWETRHASSGIVYLQPGDGVTVYRNPVYRRLIANSIEWAAGFRKGNGPR